MSKKHPEWPTLQPCDLQELHNPKLCAIIREDKNLPEKTAETQKQS